eukprot:11175773-Lingulodinium_polyedra.AAC.1
MNTNAETCPKEKSRRPPSSNGPRPLQPSHRVPPSRKARPARPKATHCASAAGAAAAARCKRSRQG